MSFSWVAHDKCGTFRGHRHLRIITHITYVCANLFFCIFRLFIRRRRRRRRRAVLFAPAPCLREITSSAMTMSITRPHPPKPTHAIYACADKLRGRFRGERQLPPHRPAEERAHQRHHGAHRVVRRCGTCVHIVIISVRCALSIVRQCTRTQLLLVSSRIRTTRRWTKWWRSTVPCLTCARRWRAAHRATRATCSWRATWSSKIASARCVYYICVFFYLF